MKDFKLKLLYLLFVFLCINHTYAATRLTREQKAAEDSLLKTAIENRHYVFQAQTAHPMAWRVVNLSYGYSLEVAPDTISAWLPYFGRAYTAPVNTEDSGIKFVSTDFDYSVKEGKKGRLDITIVPKDIPGKRYVLYLSAFPGGNCSLSVQDPDRQQIHFSGIIERLEKDGEKP